MDTEYHLRQLRKISKMPNVIKTLQQHVSSKKTKNNTPIQYTPLFDWEREAKLAKAKLLICQESVNDTDRK